MAQLPLHGQAYPLANTLTTLFVFVPQAQNAVPPDPGAGAPYGTMTSIMVCNHDDDPTTFRVALALQGASDTPAQYLYFDAPLQGNDTFLAQVNLPIRRGDVVRGLSGNGVCSFLVSGLMEDQ